MENIAEKFHNPKLSLIKILREKLRLLNQALLKVTMTPGHDIRLEHELEDYSNAYMDVIDLIESGKFDGVK